MPGPKNNPYATLRVSLDASAQDIDQSYERLKSLLSDDQLASYGMLDPGHSEQLRQELEDAYALIGQPQQRDHFDKGQHPWQLEANCGSAPEEQHTAAQKLLDEVSYGRRDRAYEQVEAQKGADPADVWSAQLSSHQAPKRRPTPTSLLVACAKSASAGWVEKLHQASDVLLEAQGCPTGGGLQQMRDTAGASLEELSDVTKINRRYLHALENNDFAQLPAGAYVRGFVGEYLRGLGLPGPTQVDVKLFVRGYMEKYQAWQQQI